MREGEREKAERKKESFCAYRCAMCIPVTRALLSSWSSRLQGPRVRGGGRGGGRKAAAEMQLRAGITAQLRQGVRAPGAL